MLMEVKNNLKIMFLSIKYNIMKCMTNNVAFATSVIMMIFNNASFIVQWLTIFTIKDTVGAYNLNDVMYFWALSSGAYGLTFILFNGLNKLPKYIENGKLDAFLVAPKNVLCYIATSSLEPSAFGDLIYGYIALIIFNFSPMNLLLYTILIFFGALIFASTVCIYNSLTFFVDRAYYFTDVVFSGFLNGSLYPDVIFNRFIKILFFTLLPCGFACWIPVHLLMDFSWMWLFILIGATTFFVVLAFIIFHLGLKKYNSSNLMGNQS